MIFYAIPRPFFEVRNRVLRLFGAIIGTGVHIYPTARIYYPWMLEIGNDSSIGEHVFIYNLGRIRVGSRATISYKAHLCAGTHDYTDPSLPLIRSSILIGDDSWICTEAYIGPGVSIGTGSVIGARAVVVKDVPERVVFGGNPARFLKNRTLKIKPPATERL